MTSKSSNNESVWNPSATPAITVRIYAGDEPPVIHDFWQVDGGYKVVTSHQVGLSNPKKRGRTFHGDGLAAIKSARKFFKLSRDKQTLIYINSPLIDLAWLQEAISLDVGELTEALEAIDWDEFESRLPDFVKFPDYVIEADWDQESLPCWPAVIFPYGLWSEGNKYCSEVPVLVSGVRVPTEVHSSGTSSYLPVLFYESSEGYRGDERLPAGEVWIEHSWFSDGGGAPISWDGGANVMYVGRGIFLEEMYGDWDNKVTGWCIGKPTENKLAKEVSLWLARTDLEQWMAINGVFDPQETWVLSDEDRERYSTAMSQLDEYVGISFMTPEPITHRVNKLMASTPAVKLIHDFFTTPKFVFREHMLQMLEESAQSGVPGPLLDGSLDVAYLAENYTGVLEGATLTQVQVDEQAAILDAAEAAHRHQQILSHFESLQKEGQRAWGRGDYSRALVVYAQYYVASKEFGDALYLADAIHKLASAYEVLGNVDRATQLRAELSPPCH